MIMISKDSLLNSTLQKIIIIIIVAQTFAKRLTARMNNALRDHLFSTYTNFSEKLTFLTS